MVYNRFHGKNKTEAVIRKNRTPKQKVAQPSRSSSSSSQARNGGNEFTRLSKAYTPVKREACSCGAWGGATSDRRSKSRNKETLVWAQVKKEAERNLPEKHSEGLLAVVKSNPMLIEKILIEHLY